MRWILFAIFLLPTRALAAVTLPNPLEPVDDLSELINRVLSYALGIVGAIATIFFIYGGFLLLTSAGSPAQVTKGKNTLIYAIIGMAAIILSYSILQFFFSLFTGNPGG